MLFQVALACFQFFFQWDDDLLFHLIPPIKIDYLLIFVGKLFRQNKWENQQITKWISLINTNSQGQESFLYYL